MQGSISSPIPPKFAPKLPANLSVGGIKLFTMGASYINFIVGPNSDVPHLKLAGKLNIQRCDSGLQLSGDRGFFLSMHYSQIKEVSFLDSVKYRSESKSVLARAGVGAVLLGPAGAIVGGLTGLSKKQISVNAIRLVYWDENAKSYLTLVAETENSMLKSFANDIENSSLNFKMIHDMHSVGKDKPYEPGQNEDLYNKTYGIKPTAAVPGRTPAIQRSPQAQKISPMEDPAVQRKLAIATKNEGGIAEFKKPFDAAVEEVLGRINRTEVDYGHGMHLIGILYKDYEAAILKKIGA
jgi:hypothetical protein